MINSQRESRKMLDEIESRADDLTDWEQRFIDSVSRLDIDLTAKQREIIDRIHSEKVR